MTLSPEFDEHGKLILPPSEGGPLLAEPSLLDTLTDAADEVTGGLWTSYHNSSYFGTVLDTTDQLFAGWSSALTGGWSTSKREEWYGQDATKNHSGAVYRGGQVVGVVHNLAMLYFGAVGLVNGIRSAASGLLQSVGSRLGSIITSGSSALRWLVTTGYRWVGTIGGAIYNWGQRIWNGVGDKISRFTGAISNTWSRFSGWVQSLFQNCFPPDTLVSTETGLRRIDEVEAGDRVWAYDFHAGQWRLSVVECRDDSVYEGPLVQIDLGHSQVKATAFHPFWVVEGADLAQRCAPRHLPPGESEGLSLPGRWVNSHELRAGDVIWLRNGERARIVRLEQWYERTPVCNLTVRGLHTFAVGEAAVLVHNASASDAARTRADVLLEIEKKSSDLDFMNQIIRNDWAVEEGIQIPNRTGSISEVIKALRGMGTPDARAWVDAILARIKELGKLHGEAGRLP
jgi:hypothetical protein